MDVRIEIAGQYQFTVIEELADLLAKECPDTVKLVIEE